MRKLFFLFSAFSLTLLLSCGGEVQTTQNQNPDNETSSTDVPQDSGSTEDYNNAARRLPQDVDAPECEISGKVLEDNQVWMSEQAIIAVIVADSTTYDEDYGDSHRVLEIYDANTCKSIDRHVLPVNVSPDFPYYMAEINYNGASKMVAIKGFDKIFYYDLASRRLLSPLEPVFKGERYADDAQSGMIQRLELWENYLVGAAQDMGVFVFDLSNIEEPKVVEPFAEYEISEADFGSLFMIPSAQGGQQIIMPNYNIATDEFAVNPFFEKPKELNTAGINQSARNNRFLVIRESNQNRTPLAIDLQKRQLVQLPADVAGRQTQQILQWMREKEQ